MNRRGQDASDSISGVSIRILRYLEQNPNAADTLEGIVEWWVPKQALYEEEKVVKKALDDMVKRNLLLTNQSSDARQHYRLNAECIEEIRRIIREAEDV